MAWESEVMELCVRFCCRGLDVGLGLCQAVGTNENKGEGFVEGEEVKDKELRLLETL